MFEIVCLRKRIFNFIHHRHVELTICPAYLAGACRGIKQGLELYTGARILYLWQTRSPVLFVLFAILLQSSEHLCESNLVSVVLYLRSHVALQSLLEVLLH